MSDVLCFLGADPGPTTGLAVGYWDGESWLHPAAYQCDAGSAPALLAWLAEENELLATWAQVEEFRPGTGAGARGLNASVTRTLVGELQAVLEPAVPAMIRPAATVKPWATDERLKKAGLLAVCHGMPHAADAMRHLLYRAVRDAGVPDPLSRRGK